MGYGVKEKWLKIVNKSSEVDITFLILRILTLFGGILWLILAPHSPEEKNILLTAFLFFGFYSTTCYIVIFLKLLWLKHVYLVSLFLDLIFLTYLISSQSALENSFFVGFYLLVCLHTIYFGLRFGLLVATLSASLYLACIYDQLMHFTWMEVALRLAFLYLIALPVGLLSEKVKRDKQTVEKLNMELAESLEDLRSIQKKLIDAEKLSALGRQTAYIAHEIRNPLTALGGFARRLDKKLENGSPEKEYVAIMTKEVARLEKILLDTLVYGKTTDSKLVRDDLNQPVSAAVSLFDELCQENAITLVENLAPDLPMGKIDREQIQQAMDSIISNSIQAMPEGGMLTVQTGQEVKNNTPYLSITVKDTGEGIDPELIEYIFEPFYSTKKIGTGTGLGLPIVKKIIDEHRGLIEVHNLPDKGTAFAMHFPFQSEEDDQKIPCWEFLKCGIEADASRRCSAYPYFGRICWSTAGSFSETGIQGVCAQKIENCQQCSFYKMVNYYLPVYTDA